MKVALVHDYLKEYGGAERVVEALHDIFPEAPLYTAYLNLDSLGPHAQKFKNWEIKTSFLQKIPFASKLLSPLRILAPLMFESFDLKEYDLVISSCNIYFAKAVITKPESLHLSYIHTPTRYLYGYTTSFNYKKKWWTKIGAEIINHFLRLYDFEVSQRPDILIANSENVAQRIKKFYRRDSVVIYPPIDIDQFKKLKKEKGEYFLVVSRLWKGKGIDIIVEACSKLNLPLKVVGDGPELENLKRLSSKSVSSSSLKSGVSLANAIEFLGSVSDEQRNKLYSQAIALIVAAQDEDFGITPVEAQAAQTPVIALRSGGFLETVVEGKTGEFFDEPSTESLMAVLENFNPQKYKTEDLLKNAQRFSFGNFKKEILDWVDSNLKG